LKYFKEQLLQRLSAVWSVVGLWQTVVDEATDEWRRYLPACVICEGTPFWTSLV